jgi:membrane protease YdiL (CAAX protease family)
VSIDSSFVLLAPPSGVALVAVLVLVVIAVPAVGALAASRARDVDDSSARKRIRYARTMLILWTMTALALYALALHGETVGDVGLHTPENPGWYAVGPLCVAILLSISGAGRGDISEAYARAIRPVVPRTAGDWLWFVPLAATAALCEEFLYRGYALTQIAVLTHSVIAGVVISSLAFGLGHAYQGRIGMAGAALTGLMYAGLFVFSGSLVPCMLAHFLQDIIGATLLSRRLYGRPAYSVGPTNPAGEED